MVRMAAYACVAFVVSLLGCELVRRYSIRRSLLDRPNDRSLHVVPVPRLGGTAIVAVTVALGACSLGASPLVRVLLLSLVVAGLGLVDDLRPLPARIRFVVQILASAALVTMVRLPSSLELAEGVSWALPSAALVVLAVVWTTGLLNVYNFMDGMDGLAGTQAVFASVALGVSFARAEAFDLAALALLFGASSAGFLAQNFPPARIFMGDAGSTFVGFLFAAFVLLGASRGVRVTESVLPLAPFLLDGTFTILRRAAHREPVWKAHRTHLYQRAVTAGLSHRDVLLVYAAWMALSCVGAMVAKEFPLLAWSAAFVELGAVILWVRALESRRVVREDHPPR